MRSDQRRARWTPERLAYWYFRLNGFLTTENFVVHPDRGRDQRTDADLLAARCSYRAENLFEPMQDDPRVADCGTFINVVIAEIKTGPCALNGPWTNPDAQNMQRVVKAIGCVPDGDVDAACADLYKHGRWLNDVVTVRLFALGERRTRDLIAPESQQVTWDEVMDFCVERFRDYKYQKSSVGQWTQDGIVLRKEALGSDAKTQIRKAFGLNAMSDGSSEYGAAPGYPESE